ncbi:MAG: hypothetical protein GY801_26595 [bacterium]|nr:hypothetical protein [bacterium]
MPHSPQYAIKTLVPEAVYTDRQEFIDYLYEYARAAGERRAMSTVLLGKRRMGKTEIFKRVVNRLFFEQDHTDPKAVVPIYYSFRDKALNPTEFAVNYLENFIRWYAAFRLREPGVLVSPRYKTREALIRYISTNMEMSESFASILELPAAFEEGGVTLPAEQALLLPRTLSDYEENTIVMFLDEFQNTRLPQDEFDIVGFLQQAVESPTCPHFVTGSAMTILSKDILGRGSLFGRFESHPIEAMTEYWGAELARRAAIHYHAQISELFFPVISHRCGGNPFYITAVVKQAAKQGEIIDSEEIINKLLAVDLSSGFIWAELNDQVMRWIERINEYGITKWVLYLSALEEGERIELEHIQQQLYNKDRQQVELATIRDVLIRLSRGDLLEYMELGGWFRKVDDPILLDFLKAWGKFEVEGQRQTKIVTDTIKQYDRLKRQINDQKDYFAEIYLSQILVNTQCNTFPGQYFHTDKEVVLPRPFYDVRHRLRLDASAESEVDVYASTGTEFWICESKWWETRKVGVKEVNEFLELADKLKAFEGREYFEGERPLTLRLWLFAHNGVTPEAEMLLLQHHIYWSTREDLDNLIQLTGLRRLPTFHESDV